jgi:hypothetical protein
VVSLGLAVQHNNGRATELGLFRSTGWSVHFAGKRRGLSVLAEVLGREERLAGAPAANSWGFLAQAGWMVWRERLELAARLGSLDRPGSENDSQEVGVGFSWFLDGHALKLQGDVRALSLETQDDRLEGRLQLQVTF